MLPQPEPTGPGPEEIQAELQSQFLALGKAVDRLARQFPAFGPRAEAIRGELNEGVLEVLQSLDQSAAPQEMPRYL